MILPLSVFQLVSMSVGKRVFPKMAHRIFLKRLMKLRCPKGKQLTEPDFWPRAKNPLHQYFNISKTSGGINFIFYMLGTN